MRDGLEGWNSPHLATTLATVIWPCRNRVFSGKSSNRSNWRKDPPVFRRSGQYGSDLPSFRRYSHSVSCWAAATFGTKTSSRAQQNITDVPWLACSWRGRGCYDTMRCKRDLSEVKRCLEVDKQRLGHERETSDKPALHRHPICPAANVSEEHTGSHSAGGGLQKARSEHTSVFPTSCCDVESSSETLATAIALRAPYELATFNSILHCLSAKSCSRLLRFFEG